MIPQAPVLLILNHPGHVKKNKQLILSQILQQHTGCLGTLDLIPDYPSNVDLIHKSGITRNIIIYYIG